jgi:membrane protein implicated in regulation of membrane protease activity
VLFLLHLGLDFAVVVGLLVALIATNLPLLFVVFPAALLAVLFRPYYTDPFSEYNASANSFIFFHLYSQ